MVFQEPNQEIIHLVWELLLNKMASFRDVGDLQVRYEFLHYAVFQNRLDPREFVDIILLPHDNKHWDLEFWIFKCIRLMERPAIWSIHIDFVKNHKTSFSDCQFATVTCMASPVDIGNQISHKVKHTQRDHPQWTTLEEVLTSLQGP